jgi:hypothetical protein
LIALARAGGVSVDWLATGVERELDLPRLQAALDAYEEGLKVTGRITRDSAKRARLIAAIYSWLGKQRRAPKRAEIIELFNQVA